MFWVLSLFSQNSAMAFTSTEQKQQPHRVLQTPARSELWKHSQALEKNLIVIPNFLHFIVLQQSSSVWGNLSMSWGLTWFSYTTVSKVLADSLQTSHFMLTAPWILSWLRLSLSAGPVSSDASAEKCACGEWPTGNAHPSVLLPWSPSIREHHQWVQVRRSSAWFLSFLLFSDWLDGAA